MAFPLTLLFLALFLGWTLRYWDAGREVVLSDLKALSRMGDAVETMAQQLREGTEIKEAVADLWQGVFSDDLEGPY